MMTKSLKRIAITLGLTLVASISVNPAKAANFTVVANGLNSPRGLTFGPNGALYITEAGSGGNGNCVPSPSIPGANLCYGTTGAVSKLENNILQTLITGLPSLASLGTSAIPDGSDASGPNDIAFDANGNAYVIVGFASNPNNRDTLIGVSDFGQILKINNLNSTPTLTPLADLATYEINNNPDGDTTPGGINSNPYSMIIQGNTIFAIDAGGNDLLSIDINTGNIATEAIFPIRNVSNPFGGPDIVMQSVPTSVTKGADGAFYVTELTGFPFPQNQARMYRVANNTVEIYLDGFTNLIDAAFAPNGDLYVLEYAANSMLSGDPTGALIKVTPNGQRTTILSQGLINPTALAIAPDNSIYISNNAFLPGVGEIIKVDLSPNPASTPEPSPVLSLLAISSLVTSLRFLKT